MSGILYLRKMKETFFPDINLADYTYVLPEERIASHPAGIRDEARLLVYKNGDISHHIFSALPSLLPKNTTLFFNNTRVMPARLHFKKHTGATIEIFIIKPTIPSPDIVQAMATTQSCSWQCLIGNLKKWKNTETLQQKITIDGKAVTVHASLINRKHNEVRFDWTGNLHFSHVLEELGKIPLPPYIKRDAEPEDKVRYQTIYAENEGAVAAPTAGLHFTHEVLENLSLKGIKSEFLTLHVSTGTFQPIQSDDVAGHPMHAEEIWVTRQNIEQILNSEFTIAVGTTSLRALESTYWFGVKLLESGDAPFIIEKDFPYNKLHKLPDARDALGAVYECMNRMHTKSLKGITRLFIVPGYKFRLAKGIITNYHMPGSTLILLVAAFIGKDWKSVYSEALNNHYRFLSYGDSSLLLP